MNWKGDSSVHKASNFKIEPAFRVTFIVGSLGITGGPETVVIVGSTNGFVEIAGIEATIEENIGFSWLVEFKAVALR